MTKLYPCVILDTVLKPENITLMISSEQETFTTQFDHMVNLTFTWSPITTETSCMIQYQVNASNCGSCPSTTTSTCATCAVSELTADEQLCTFIVQPVIHESTASLPSEPYTISIKGSYVCSFMVVASK